MNTSPEFEQGVRAKLNGKSEFYNPYRNSVAPQQFQDWLDGWLFIDEEKSPTTKKEIVEHPRYVIDAIDKLSLSHPDYCG